MSKEDEGPESREVSQLFAAGKALLPDDRLRARRFPGDPVGSAVKRTMSTSWPGPKVIEMS